MTEALKATGTDGLAGGGMAPTPDVQALAQASVGREVEIDKLYSEIVLACWLDSASNKILSTILSGNDSADLYASILRFDPALQEFILKCANSMGLEKKIEDPSHAISVLGMEQVRDSILGRGIYMRFFKADAKPGAPDPSVADYIAHVELARKAESVARGIKNAYPALAYAGGILFDILRAKFKTMKVPERANVESPLVFLDNIWKRSLRAGIAATLLSEFVTLAHKRFAFVTALVHNIGKLLLYAYAPSDYQATIEFVKTNKVESSEEERRRFGLDHAQIGALYLAQLKFLGEVEMAVDFHHGNWLLKYQNLPMYHFAGLMHTAAKIVSQVNDKDTMIVNEKDPFFAKEEFLCIGISLADFIKVQKKYLKLKDMGGAE